jgi:penicillin-binding protein 2
VRRVLDAMDAVTNEAGGTAFRLRNDDPRFMISGKTGTAQVRRITREERASGVRKNEDLPWELRDHALFVCYGPTSAPRYACAVIVDHGGSGSKAAAPRARDIMNVCLERDPARLPPVAPLAAAAPTSEG